MVWRPIFCTTLIHEETFSILKDLSTLPNSKHNTKMSVISLLLFIYFIMLSLVLILWWDPIIQVAYVRIRWCHLPWSGTAIAHDPLILQIIYRANAWPIDMFLKSR